MIPILIFLDTISKVALVQLRSKTCIWFFFVIEKKTGNDYKYMNLIMLVSLCVILFLQILTKRSRYKTEIDICCQQFEPFKNNSFNIQPSIRPDFFDKISKVSSIFFWPLLLVLMGFSWAKKFFWIFFFDLKVPGFLLETLKFFEKQDLDQLALICLHYSVLPAMFHPSRQCYLPDQG